MRISCAMDGEVIRLGIPGDFVSTRVAEIREGILHHLETYREKEWKILELDLTDARMVDSVGENLLISLIRYLQERNGRMRVLVSSLHVVRVFKVTDLDKKLEMVLKEGGGK